MSDTHASSPLDPTASAPEPAAAVAPPLELAAHQTPPSPAAPASQPAADVAGAIASLSESQLRLVRIAQSIENENHWFWPERVGRTRWSVPIPTNKLIQTVGILLAAISAALAAVSTYLAVMALREINVPLRVPVLERQLDAARRSVIAAYRLADQLTLLEGVSLHADRPEWLPEPVALRVAGAVGPASPYRLYAGILEQCQDIDATYNDMYFLFDPELVGRLSAYDVFRDVCRDVRVRLSQLGRNIDAALERTAVRFDVPPQWRDEMIAVMRRVPVVANGQPDHNFRLVAEFHQKRLYCALGLDRLNEEMAERIREYGDHPAASPAAPGAPANGRRYCE